MPKELAHGQKLKFGLILRSLVSLVLLCHAESMSPVRTPEVNDGRYPKGKPELKEVVKETEVIKVYCVHPVMVCTFNWTVCAFADIA